MEQTSTLPEFASRRQAGLWLMGEFTQVVAVGFAIMRPFGVHIMVAMVGFLSLMGLSFWLSVANKPSYPVGSRRSKPALYRAASDHLGSKVSLIWVQIALAIVLFIAIFKSTPP